MGRNKGTFNFAANFEVLTKAPLDARLVVDTKADLINPVIWQDIASNVWLFKGIVVSVVSDPSTDNNGLYFLTDETTYTSYSSWIKINGIVPTSDPSGTSWATFQLNNGNNGVVLKDSSGNLEVVTFDQNTYANITAGNININSLKIDTLNGALYALDGSVFAIPGTYSLKGYEATLKGNGQTQEFIVDHSLNTLRQSISIWDTTIAPDSSTSGIAIYPDLLRGLNTDIIKFFRPPDVSTYYNIIILGF